MKTNETIEIDGETYKLIVTELNKDNSGKVMLYNGENRLNDAVQVKDIHNITDEELGEIGV